MHFSIYHQQSPPEPPGASKNQGSSDYKIWEQIQIMFKNNWNMFENISVFLFFLKKSDKYGFWVVFWPPKTPKTTTRNPPYVENYDPSAIIPIFRP